MDIWDGLSGSRTAETQRAPDRGDWIELIGQVQSTQTNLNLKQDDTAEQDGGASGYHKLAFGTTPSANAEAGYNILWVGADSLYHEHADGTDYLVFDEYSIRGPGNLPSNVALGDDALKVNSTGTANVSIGKHSLYTNESGDKNIAIGVNALKYSTADEIVSVGYDALLDNIAGTGHTGVGFEALKSNTSGVNNTAFGHQALTSVVSNDENTAIGYQALSAATNGKNTAIGYHCLKSNTTGTNNTGVGNNAQGSSASTTNEITLGDSNVATLRCNTQSIVALSDLRDKTDITDLPLGIDFINKTRPVKFTWDRREESEQNGQDAIGFIAQDLLETQKDFGAGYVNSVLESNPEKLEASYASLIPIMVQALKDLSKENQELRNLITNT
jgi:hypothetical protein